MLPFPYVKAYSTTVTGRLTVFTIFWLPKKLEVSLDRHTHRVDKILDLITKIRPCYSGCVTKIEFDNKITGFKFTKDYS